MPVYTKAATDRLMRFLKIEGVTGKEAAIGRDLVAALKDVGVPADAIHLDRGPSTGAQRYQQRSGARAGP